MGVQLNNDQLNAATSALIDMRGQDPYEFIRWIDKDNNLYETQFDVTYNEVVAAYKMLKALQIGALSA